MGTRGLCQAQHLCRQGITKQSSSWEGTRGNDIRRSLQGQGTAHA